MIASDSDEAGQKAAAAVPKAPTRDTGHQSESASFVTLGGGIGLGDFVVPCTHASAGNVRVFGLQEAPGDGEL